MRGITPFGPVVIDAAAVGVGAVCGAICRYQVGKAATERIAANPKRLGHLAGWHTAGINILGSFVLGCVSAFPDIGSSGEQSPAAPPPANATTNASSKMAGFCPGLSPRVKLMLGVGFCGSFTTFSTYSVDVVSMIGRGDTTMALRYILANNFGCIAAAGSGMSLVKKIWGR